MTDKEHARAMDLPDYPCPPNLGAIAAHAGSWGWANPADSIAQDADGYLWVKTGTRLSPTPSTSLDVLGTWTEDGIGVYVPKRSYGFIRSIPTLCAPQWVPVAVVLKEPPAYAVDFNAA